MLRSIVRMTFVFALLGGVMCKSGGPKPPPPVVGGEINCQELTTAQHAGAIISAVTQALLTGDYIAALTQLAATWGVGPVDCAVLKVSADARRDAKFAAHDVGTESLVNNGDAWMARQNVKIVNPPGP